MKYQSFFTNILAGAAVAVASVIAVPVAAQTLHPLEPVSGHYKTLAARSGAPDREKAALDTILFPWAEYSSGALANTLLRTVYLSAEDEAKLPQLVRFPANSSEQTRAELDYLLALQNSRTKEQVARAEAIARIGVWPTLLNPTDSNYAGNLAQLYYIAAPVGHWYTYERFPATTQLLWRCIQDIRVTEFRLKQHFRRARPYHLEPALQPLARMSSPAFASGHTLWAFAQAFLFGEIIPEKRAAFLALAEEVRWSRELMGIHYPSDNEASRVLAWHLMQNWHRNPQFVADLQKAKEEWSRKKGAFAVK